MVKMSNKTWDYSHTSIRQSKTGYTEKHGHYWICEICKKEWKYKSSAKNCENLHKKGITPMDGKN